MSEREKEVDFNGTTPFDHEDPSASMSATVRPRAKPRFIRKGLDDETRLSQTELVGGD